MKNYKATAKWLTLFHEQESSGLSAIAFCREKKIHPNIFYRKRKEYRTNRFVKLPIPGENSSGIRIRIGEVIIEPGMNFQQEELKRIIETVKEVFDAYIQ